MKKLSIMLVSLSLTVVFVFLLLTVFIKDYTLDLSQFEKEVIHNGEVIEESIIIQKKTLFGKKDIMVTPDMVTNVDTSTPGEKKLTITYGGETFEVVYHVKFKVEFKDGSELISSQTVFAASEIVVPELTNKPGYLFVGWDIDIPSVLTSNLVINAKYEALDTKLPNLGTYNATYEDTLSSITLPSNEYGKWEFIDPLTTTVGNVGSNKFRVKFVSNYDLGQEKIDEVTIRVSKKTLEFKDLVLSFVYDGDIKRPTFSFGEGYDHLISKVLYNGDTAINVGKYGFILELNDENYQASYQGSMEITSPQIVITVNSYTINYGDSLPIFEYSVTGLEDASLLNIKLIEPNVVNAGTYEINVTVTTDLFKDITINKGTLTVNKINMYDFEGKDSDKLPVLSDAYYSDLISAVTFSENPNGYWKWKEESVVISTPKEFTAKATFVPKSPNYLEQEYEFTFEVLAKELTFDIKEDTFVYDGLEHSLIFEVKDDKGKVIEGLTFEGVKVGVDANLYPNNIIIVDGTGCYAGSIDVTMTIEKATPTVDWSKVYTAQYSQTLKDVLLDEHFYWDSEILDTPLTVIDTFEFDAKYDRRDSNYNIVYGKLIVEVGKLTVRFDENNEAETSYTYNGTPFELNNLVTPFPGHIETEVSYYLIDGENEVSIDQVLDAGSYKVVVTPKDTTLYDGSATINITVNKARVAAPNDYEAVFEDALGTLILPTSEYGYWTWKDGNDTTVGNVNINPNKFVASFTSTNKNYESYDADVNILVSKKELKIEIIQNEFEYDGTAPKVIYKILDAFGKEYDIASIKVVGNNVSDKNAQTYKFTLTIDDKNYLGQIETQLIISSKSIELPALDTTQYVYNGENQTYKIAESDYYTVSKERTQKNAGSYDVKIILGSKTNYIWSNGSTDDLVYVFTIQKDKYDMSKVKWDYEEPFTYDGNPHIVKLINLPEGVSVSKYTNNALRDAGTHTATAEFDYDRTNYETPEFYALEWIINQKELVIEWLPKAPYSYTYTGEVLTAPTAYVVIVGNENKMVEVSCDKKFKNAGKYTFIANLPEELTLNYTLAVEPNDVLEVEISKATFDMKNVRWNYTVPFDYDGSEFSVSLINLPKGLTVIYDGEKMTNAGTHTAKVLSFEYDKDNYNAPESIADLSWEIKPCIVDVKWNIPTYTYTGSQLDLPTAKFIFAGETYDLEVDFSGKFVDAGDYTMTAKTTDTNFELKNTTKVVTVSKATSKITNLSIKPWVYKEYDEILNKPTASTNFGDIVFTYSTTVDGNYTPSIPENAGTYYVKAEVIDTDNYDGYSATKLFTISKKAVEKPAVDNRPFTYNGEVQTYLIEPNELYYVVDNSNKKTNAGTYKVIIALKDPNNYEWKGTSSSSNLEDYSFIIAPKEVEKPNEITGYVYNGKEHTYGVSSTTEYTVSGNTTLTNAEKETITITLKNPEGITNYVWIGGSTTVLTHTFEVRKAKANITDFVMESWNYSETASTPSANTNFGSVLFTYSLTEKGDYRATMPSLNAGTYYVKAEVAGTDNYDGHTVIKSYTINKKAVGNPVIIDNGPFTYNGSVQTYLIETNELYYVVDNSNKQTNAGTHTVFIALKDKDNYIWAGTFSSANLEYQFVISPMEIDVPNDDKNTYIYDGKEHTYVISANKAYIVSNNTRVNAGIQKVTINLVSSNYIWNDKTTDAKTKDFVVNKADPKVTWPTVNYTWGTELSSVALGEGFEWAAGVNLNEVLDTVGKISYPIKYEPADKDNYNTLNGEITINVIRKQTTIITDSKLEDLTYDPTNENGFEFIPSSNNTDENVSYEIIYYYRAPGASPDSEPEIVGSIINAGSYEVVVTTKQTGYYEAAKETFNVNVEQAFASMTTEEKASITAEYGDNFEDTILPNSVYESWNEHGTWAIVDSISTYSLRRNLPTYDSLEDKVMYAIFTPYAGEVNYKETIIEVLVKVSKRQLTFEITNELKFTYDGSAPQVSYTLLDKVDSVYTDIEVIGNNKNTNVGRHEIELTIKSDLYVGSIKVTVVITQATNEVTDLALEGWTYGETANVPTSKNKFNANAIYTYSTEEDGEYRSEVPTNAGTYYVKAFVKGNANYSDALSNAKQFTINKAEATVIWEERVNNPYTYSGNKLVLPTATIKLVNSTVTHKLSTKTLDDSDFLNAGKYTIVAFIEKEEIAFNYTIINTTNEYEINKRIIEVKDSSKAYNEEIQYADLEENALYKVSGNDGFVDKGDYFITLTLKDFQNNKWGNSETDETTVKFSITATDNKWEEGKEPSISQKQYIYGIESVVVISGVSVFGDEIIVEYKLYGASAYTKEVPTNVGKYLVHVYVPATEDYGLLSWEEEFEILPQEVKVPTVLGDYTYNGKNQKLEINDFDETIMTITGVIEAKDAKTYYAYITLKSSNYVWEGTTEKTITIEFVIKACEIEVIWEINYEYTGEVLVPTAKFVFNNEEYELSVTTNKEFINVGEYTLVATNNNSNFVLKSNTTIVNIKKGTNTILVPTITGWVFGKYDEKLHKPISSSKFGSPMFLYSDKLDGTYSETIPTNAGTYFVKAKVTGTANYDEVTSDAVSFVVEQQTITIPTIKDGYKLIYTGSAHTLTKDALNGFNANIMEFVQDTNVAINAGEYEAEITLNENYKWKDTTDRTIKVSWTIQKATYTLSGITFENLTKTYTGNKVTLTITGNLPEGISVSYQDNELTNVGNTTAKAIFTVKDSINYNEIASMTATLTITPFVVATPNQGENNFVFNHSVITYNVVEDKINSSYYTVSENEKYDAGTYEAIISLNDKLNYVWSNGNTEDIKHKYTIKPYEVEKPTCTTKYIYNGQPQTFGIETTREYSVHNNINTDAGKYVVTVTLNNLIVNGKGVINYVWDDKSTDELKFDFIIEPKESTVVWPTEADLTIPWGSSLSSIDLPAGFQWDKTVDTTTILNTLGTFEFKLNYISTDSNYKDASNIVVVTVTKQQTEIKYITNNFIYNPNNPTGFDLGIKVLANKLDITDEVSSKMKTTITYNGESVDKIINAGTYTVVISFDGNDKYFAAETITVTVTVASINETISQNLVFNAKYDDDLSVLTTPISPNGTWVLSFMDDMTKFDEVGTITIKATFTSSSINYKYTETTIDVEVSQATNNITSLTLENWTYDDAPNTPNSTARFGIPAFTYSKEENGTYSETVPKDAGTYYVKAYVEGTTNYASAELVKSFVINAKRIDKPVEDETRYVYKENTTHTYGIVETDYYSVSNNTRINAGSQTVIVSLKSSNYAWEDGSTEDLKYDFIVSRANYDMSSVTISNSTFEYNGNTQSVTFNNLPAGVKVITYTGNEGINVGTYTLSATFDYDEENYNAPTKTLPWTITKKNVTVSWEDRTTNPYIYTGNELDYPNATITLLNGTVIDLNVTLDGEFKLVATYEFKAFIIEEEINNNYNLISNTKNYTIEKATPETNFNIALDYVSYGTLLSTIGLPKGYAWINPTTVLTTVGESSYAVRFTPEDSDNYKTVDGSVKVTVLPRTTTLILDDLYTHNYNGEEYDLTNEVKANLNHEETVTITFKYYLVNDSNVIQREVNSIVTPGRYKIEVTVSASVTYSEAEDYTYVVVNKGSLENNVVIPELSYSHNTELNKNEFLIETDLGNWTLVNESIKLDITKAVEENTVTLLFTPNDTNYNTFEVNVTVEVTKLDATISYEIPQEIRYINATTEIDYKSWFITNPSGLELSFSFKDANDNPVEKIINPGEYYITYSFSGNNIYNEIAADETPLFTVLKSSYTPSSIPANLTATYGQILASVDFTQPSDGTWEWVDSETLVGNVGTKSFSATFKPRDENYELSTHLISVSVSKYESNTVTININSTIEIDGEVVNGWVYNGKNPITATTIYGIAKLYYSTSLNDEYNEAFTPNAGTYYVKAVVEGTDNYNGDETEPIMFIIKKATPVVTIPTYGCDESRPYEGEVKKITDGKSDVDGTFSVNNITFGSNQDPSTEIKQSTGGYANAQNGIASYYYVTFTPTDLVNYEVVTIKSEETITLKPVCYVGSIYYGTIEVALNNNTSGTVFVIPGTNPVIRENVTISGNVTLFLPYMDGQSLKGDAGNAEIYIGSADAGHPTIDTTGNTLHSGPVVFDNFATTVPNLLKSTVTIASGKVLTISDNAKVEIAGQLGAGGGGCNAAGQTVGWYSRFALETNAKIVNNGTIYCYGYIDEAIKNNGSEVTNNKDIYMPFIMRDFRGGSIMYAVYGAVDQYKISPFNQFEFRNITVLTRTNYGGNVITWANLYSNNDYQFTKAQIIGNTNAAIIKLEESYSYLTCKFDVDTEIHEINIYGGATSNPMNLKVENTNIDTSKVYFPISWRFDVTLRKNPLQSENEEAVYTMEQMFKMMPGAKLTIESGVIANINSLNVYTSFTDQIIYRTKSEGGASGIFSDWTDYIYSVPRYQDRSPYAKVPATLTVNGTLNAKSLAGYVYTSKDGAVLNVETSTSLTTYEPYKISSASFLSTFDDKTYIPETLKLKMYSNGSAANSHTNASIGKYYSKDGGWYKSGITISYNTNGAGTIASNPIKDIGNAGYTLTADDIPAIERKHYTPVGWYFINSEGVKEFVNKDNLPTIYEDTTLYFEWTIDKYSIDYVEKYVNGDVVEDINSNNKNNLNDEFTVETTTAFTKDGTDLSFAGYQFMGYYIDSVFQTQIPSLNGSELLAKFPDGNVTIYIKWTPIKETYVINFSANAATDYSDYSSTMKLEDLNSINVNDFSNPFTLTADKDTNYTKYFSGWGQNGKVLSEEEIIALFKNAEFNEKMEKNIMLNPVWGTKFSLTIVKDYSSGIKDSSVTTWYKSGQTSSAITFNNVDGYYMSGITSTSSGFSNGNTITVTADTTVTATYLKIIKVTINAPGRGIGRNFDIYAQVTSGYSGSAQNNITNNTTEYKAIGNSGVEFYVTEGTVLKMTQVDLTLGSTTCYINGISIKKGQTYTVKGVDIVISK